MEHLDVMEIQGQAAAVDMGAKVTYGELPLTIGNLVLYIDGPFILGMN